MSGRAAPGDAGGDNEGAILTASPEVHLDPLFLQRFS
jgi:hypothetical protein